MWSENPRNVSLVSLWMCYDKKCAKLFQRNISVYLQPSQYSFEWYPSVAVFVICCMIAESTGRIPYILSHKNTNLDMNPDSTGPQSPILFLKMEKYTIETKYCRPVWACLLPKSCNNTLKKELEHTVYCQQPGFFCIVIF